MEMEQTKTPKLRFRQDDGTEFPIWESITLETEGNFYNGLSGKTKDDFDHGDAKFIPYIAVYNGTFLNDEILKPVDVHSNERQNKIHNGDLLFTQSSETLEEVGMAAVWMSPSTPYLNSFCFGFRLNKQSHISPEFMGHLMRSPYARRLISTQGQGISRFNISASRLGKIHFMSPAAKEQKKIANFFTAFDCRIALADKKLATLQTIKKGMLQKIFSQELRFKDDDGNEFPAWKVKKLGDICQVNPKSPRLDDKFYYIDLDSVTNGQLSLKAPIQKDNAPSRAQRVVQLGDVLFQMVRPYQLNHYLVNKKFDLQTVASTGFAQLRCKENDSKFVYQILFTENFNHKVLVRCIGTGYPAINANDLSEIQTAIPSLPEQRKISDYFTALDDAIAAAQKKASALRAIKKGLLQKMFV